MSSSLVQMLEEFGKWVYQHWVRPFSHSPCVLDRCCNESGSSEHFPWPLRHLFQWWWWLVRVIGPRTKQGCSRLISNVTGATSRRGCLFRLRSVTSRSKMFPSLCVADIKSSIFVFSFSWVIGNASCLLPCMSDQATQFLLPSPGPGMSLFPLFVYLNPTCLKDWPPPWSLHSRMHGTPVFVSQVGALISPCTGFCFLCLTVPGCSGHREWWQIHWMKHNEGYRKSRDLGIQRPGFVTLDKSLPVSGFQSLSVKWELNRIISKVHSRSKVLGLIVD